MLNTIQAQTNETLFPSASSISVLKGASGDVSLYSGKVDVDIPIYTVKEGGLSHNIALKYTGGNGIKVQEIAGDAGLGWAMMAGGVITRIANRYLGVPNSGRLKSTDSLDLIKGVPSAYSLNLDVFNSTIGGRIIYDLDNKAHFMNERGFKIEEDGVNSPSQGWIIVSPTGDRYFFGETDLSKEKFVMTTTTKYLSSKASAWHLSKIISAKGEVIQFEYEKGDINTLVQYKYWEMFRSKNSNESESTNDIKELKSENEGVRLKKIITSHSVIYFSYKNREDVVNGKSIAEIMVSDKKGSLVTSFLFDTDYFKSSDVVATKRLKLNSIRQKNSGMNTHLVAAFEYNETENLPAGNSPSFDYWGYYNNNNTGKYFVSEGANRAADLNKCKANMLTSIRWPTGGITQYFYELNTYMRKGVQYNGGGVRISSIKDIDGTKVLKTTSYDYSTLLSGKMVTSGLMHSWFDITKGYVAKFTRKSYFFKEYFNYSEKENALPIRKIADLDGISIGYSRVTITHTDQSSDEYNFQDYSNFPDQVKFYSYTNVMRGTTEDREIKAFKSDNETEDYNGLNSFTSNSQQRGLVSKKVVRNSKNEILKIFQYKYNTLINLNIAGVELLALGEFNPSKTSFVGLETYLLASVFNERVMSVRLSEVKEDSFYLGSPTIQSNTITNEYKPFPQPFLLTKQMQKQSDGTLLSLSYSYPSDMVALWKDITGVYADMISRNIITPVIEKIEMVDNVQIRLNRTNYSLFNFTNSSLPLPKSIEGQTGFNSIETAVLFNVYDTKGNLVETKLPDGSSSVTLWGYNKQFPVLTVKNVTYAQVRNILGDTQIENLGAISVADESIENAANEIRAALPQALIGFFTYDPLRGMTSKTDERGISEYYDYDGFGRLKAVRDYQGNILNTYCYNYKNELIDCGTVPLRNIDDRIALIPGKISIGLSTEVGENLSYVIAKDSRTIQEIGRVDFPESKQVMRYLHIPEEVATSRSLILVFYSQKSSPDHPAVDYKYQLESEGPVWRISDGVITSESKMLEVPLSGIQLKTGQVNLLMMDRESPVIVPPAKFYMGSNFVYEGGDFSDNGGRVSGTLNFRSPPPFSGSAADFVYVGAFADTNLNPSVTRQFYSGSWLCEVRNGASPRLYIKWIGSGAKPWGTDNMISININYTK